MKGKQLISGALVMAGLLLGASAQAQRLGGGQGGFAGGGIGAGFGRMGGMSAMGMGGASSAFNASAPQGDWARSHATKMEKKSRDTETAASTAAAGSANTARGHLGSIESEAAANADSATHAPMLTSTANASGSNSTEVAPKGDRQARGSTGSPRADNPASSSKSGAPREGRDADSNSIGTSADLAGNGHVAGSQFSGDAAGQAGVHRDRPSSDAQTAGEVSGNH